MAAVGSHRSSSRPCLPRPAPRHATAGPAGGGRAHLCAQERQHGPEHQVAQGVPVRLCARVCVCVCVCVCGGGGAVCEWQV
jgi:hypothetical protein